MQMQYQCLTVDGPLSGGGLQNSETDLTLLTPPGRMNSWPKALWANGHCTVLQPAVRVAVAVCQLLIKAMWWPG